MTFYQGEVAPFILGLRDEEAGSGFAADTKQDLTLTICLRLTSATQALRRKTWT
jgi:hypothetical protein